jgi:hypothetical protein
LERFLAIFTEKDDANYIYPFLCLNKNLQNRKEKLIKITV